jgi:hypothetical protein
VYYSGRKIPIKNEKHKGMLHHSSSSDLEFTVYLVGFILAGLGSSLIARYLYFKNK